MPVPYQRAKKRFKKVILTLLKLRTGFLDLIKIDKLKDKIALLKSKKFKK